MGNRVSAVSSETTPPIRSSVQIEAFVVQVRSAMSAMVNVVHMWRFVIEMVDSVSYADRVEPA